MHLILVEIAEQGLRCGAHTDPLLQLLLPAVGYPGHLGSKTVDQVALLVEQVLRDHHGKIDVLHADCLEAGVQMLLNSLPKGISRGLVYHESLDIGIGDKSRLNYDICIPLCEILIHGCDLSNQFLLICHLLLTPL